MPAFSAISTGVYGYPQADAAFIAVRSAADELSTDASLRRVIFCVLDHAAEAAYRKALRQGLG